jgi:hypothetical protein
MIDKKKLYRMEEHWFSQGLSRFIEDLEIKMK